MPEISRFFGMVITMCTTTITRLRTFTRVPEATRFWWRSTTAGFWPVGFRPD